MERRTRAIVASTLVLGASIFAAPQWASGASTDAPLVESAPVPAEPAVTTTTTTVVAPAEPVTTTIPTPEPAPTTTTTTEPTPTTAVESAAVAAPADPEPTAPARQGSIQVRVNPTEGASRSVTLQTADGAVVAARVPVTGDPVVFDGLDAGAYDLFVEQDYDDGATFLTRTPITVHGDDTAVSCDDETLDCSIA